MSGRNKILRQFKSRMVYFETRFTPVMYKAIRSQIKAFIEVMKESGVSAAQRELDKIVINGEVYKAVERLYKVVGVDAANSKYKEIMDQAPQKGFGFNQEWAESIINYFRLYLLQKAVVPISETTREQIRQVLIDGEQNGWGTDEIARRLLESELTLWRARMIVRTESAKAAFYGRKLGRDKTPYKTVREWIAADDHRTRHSHRVVDGLKVEDNGKFSVPVYKRVGKVDIQIGVDLMEGPGDPRASKGNIINCRCTEGDRIVFDNEDNAIMKRNEELV